MYRRLFIWLFGILVILPVAMLVLLSLSGQWVFPGVFPRQWTAGQWANIVKGSGDLLSSLWLSLFISTSIALVVTALSFISGKQIARSKTGRRLLWLTYFPYVFAPVLLAAILQFYFIRLGLSSTIQGVLAGHMLITFPYGIILSMSFWNERIASMEQLVSTLGGSRRQAWQKVILPLARPVLTIIFFQTFLISWFEYGLTMVIGVGQVQTLTIKVFQYINAANINSAAAASILILVPPLLLLWINKKYLLVRWQAQD